MILDRIEILGFRGIKRLSLSLNEMTTLLGENTWENHHYSMRCVLLYRRRINYTNLNLKISMSIMPNLNHKPSKYKSLPAGVLLIQMSIETFVIAS